MKTCGYSRKGGPYPSAMSRTPDLSAQLNIMTPMTPGSIFLSPPSVSRATSLSLIFLTSQVATTLVKFSTHPRLRIHIQTQTRSVKSRGRRLV